MPWHRLMKITLEKDKCIGCGACEALCGKFFELKAGKSSLKNGKKQGKNEVLEGAGAPCFKEAEKNCPVKCIKLSS